MSKPATFEPLVLEELRKHPEGITRRDLREKVGCSSQQIHKIIEKGKLPAGHRQHLPIVVLGKGEFGSDIVALRENIVSPVAGTSNRTELPPLPGFGQVLKVVGLNMNGPEGIEVTVETEDGQRLTLHQ